MAILEREMDQENSDPLELKLDQESLDARFKIMEVNLAEASSGDKCVGLFPDDR